MPNIRKFLRFRELLAATFVGLAILALLSSLAPAGEPEMPMTREGRWGAVDRAVEEAVQKGATPGGVVLIGHGGNVVYRKAFGLQMIEPVRVPASLDTIFDLSSLTKVIATAPAVMHLAERGKLKIEAPVVRYWPDFRGHGKERITIKELLTHVSGLRAGFRRLPSNYAQALKKLAAEKPECAPGSLFNYSDLNFAVLGEVVRRVSGESLENYCATHLFGPLGMKETVFRPPAGLLGRIAPTQYRKGKMLQGEVHDPLAWRMGGAAGHAGLFSTADDLAIFAQFLLDGGRAGDPASHGVQGEGRVLLPETIRLMTSPRTPPGCGALRGLGWDIDSPYSTCRGDLFPVGSYGHTGYTGTSIWIDPVSSTYVILLTNRVHPDGKGEVKELRAKIATLAAAACGFKNGQDGNTGLPTQRVPASPVRCGIDTLASGNFKMLAGFRIGLITNHTGLDASGKRTLDLLASAPGVKLAAVFSPEHGLAGTAEGKISSGLDPGTGVLVYSLYGEVKKPTERMLEGLDALVFDIQDAGARFYTYITTLGYAMEAAAARGIPFFVLDRPNPITASAVQGPVLDEDLISFTGYFPLPVRHGMTLGELARMFKGEKQMDLDLRVIPMEGYDRRRWYDETGLPWVSPSPNLRSLAQAVLYPGVALVEGANVSVGRGTATPFELLGAPWIKSGQLADYLNSRKIQGVRFRPMDFRPQSSRFAGQLCQGVQILLQDREVLDSPALGVEIASALNRLYPKKFQPEKNIRLIGSREVLAAIKEGRDPQEISRIWQARLQDFLRLRARYLIY